MVCCWAAFAQQHNQQQLEKLSQAFHYINNNDVDEVDLEPLVAEAIAATAKKDRAAKLADAEEYLVNAMPVCPLVFNQNFVFVGSKISKLDFNGIGNLNFTDAKLKGYTKYYKPEETEE